MIHDSYLFDFQSVIKGIRHKIKNDKEKNEAITPLLDGITQDTEFEDLPLYKEYLSLFDVEHDLGDKELSFPSELEYCKADSLPLLRLVAASFSSTYDLLYDDVTNKVSLIITVESQGVTLTKILEELDDFQITRLFEIYIEEQLNMEAFRLNSSLEKDAIDEERRVKVMVYQKKLRQLEIQLEKNERIREAQKESEDILSNLDDLLNS